MDTMPQLPSRKRSKPLDLVEFALKRGPWIAALSVLIAAILLPGVLYVAKSHYQTSGNLIIAPEVKRMLSREGETITGSFRDFANTQIHRLKTEEVLTDALYRLPREEWPGFLNGHDDFQVAVRLLKQRLAVDHVKRTYLLHVGLNDSSPEGLAPMINAVMEAYITKLQQEQESFSRRRILFIHQQREDLLASMSEVNTRLEKLSGELDSHTFSDHRNVAYEYLIAVQDALARARARAAEAQADFIRFQQAEAAYDPTLEEVAAREAVFKNEAVYLIKNWTYQQLQEMRSSIDGLTETNPDRVYVESRMVAMEAYLRGFEEDLYENSLEILQKKTTQELTAETVSALRSAENATRIVTEIESQVTAAQTAFARSSELIALGKESQTTLQNLRQRLEYLDGLLAEVSLEAKAPLRIAVEEAARTPLGPAGDNRNKLIAMALLVAVALPVGGFFLFDFLDDRVTTQATVKAALGAPPLAPVMTGVAEAAALERLAVRLDRVREKKHARTVLFVPADETNEAGKLLAKLGEGLTKFTPRIALVQPRHDGQLADPSPPTLEVLSMDLTRPVPELKQQLADWRETYDLVLLALPSIRTHAVVQSLAGAVDIAVTLCWWGHTRFGALRDALDQVFAAETPTVSALLAGARPSRLEQLQILQQQALIFISDGSWRGWLAGLFKKGPTRHASSETSLPLLP